MRHTVWKNVDLPPLTEWEGIADYSFNPEGQILATADETQTLTADFSPLRPGSPTRLTATLEVTPATGATATLIFAETSSVLNDGLNRVDVETNLYLDPVLTIAGVSAVKIIAIQVQILYPDRSKPLPYDLIGFDIFTENVDPGFVIGRDRIGKAPLGGIGPYMGGFTIGQSQLDVDTLQISAPAYTWKDILGPGLSLSFRVGANQGNTLLPVAQAGSAIIEIKNFDPRENRLKIGVKARIYHRMNRRVFFTGTLASFSMTPGKDQNTPDVATLEFVDTVGILAAIKRYGVRTDTPEDLKARITRLLEGTGLAWRCLEGTPPVTNAIGSTVAEANLATYLDDTLATVAGAWWVDPDGTITINPNNEVTVYHQLPYFVIGETPLDGAKLAPETAKWIQAANAETPQVENPFIIGQSVLDAAKIAVNIIHSGFVIGESALDHATLQNYQPATEWANPTRPQPSLFTDRYTKGRNSYYYVDITPGFDSAETLTEVAIENHTAVKENGSWRDATKTFTATDPESTAIFGKSRQFARAFAATDTQAQALANYYLSHSRPENSLKYSSVQLNALKESIALSRLGLFDYVQIVYRGNESSHRIYAFENQLTPFTWMQRIYVTDANERMMMA